MNVHLLDEGYAWVPKGRVSLKIQRRRFRKIKDFELGRLPTRAIMLQEVRVLPTLVLVPPFGWIKEVFVLGTVWKKNGIFHVPV